MVARRSHQFDHVQVVEWHLVSVATEDVHATALIDVSRVSITGGGLSGDHAEFGLLGGGVTLFSDSHSKFSTLAHGLVVSVEAVVSIGDDERLFHLDGNG